MSDRNGHVGLILVSHSAKLAEGLADLLSQVAGPTVPIVTAAGAVDGSLGTNGGAVLEAMQRAAADGGAVVLVDLGSSILAVRAALAELSDEELARVALADAPLVEGGMSAAVAASTGCTLEEAVRAAEEARVVAKL
ncbi:MAG TPA: dihydroxyacetone kinase phosphoryl donor subunit DhaM [Gaiellaceae bacterium]|jgi:phosphoenolpyruvate---glycerone phosphotransferase subunit DhaM